MSEASQDSKPSVQEFPRLGAKKQKQKNGEGVAVGLCECCQGHLMLQQPHCRTAPALCFLQAEQCLLQHLDQALLETLKLL